MFLKCGLNDITTTNDLKMENSAIKIIMNNYKSDGFSMLKKLFDKAPMESHKNIWFLETKSNTTLNPLISMLNLNLMSNVYPFIQHKDIIELWEAYKVHQNYSMTLKPFSYWTNAQGFNNIQLPKKWERRTDLQVLRQRDILLC